MFWLQSLERIFWLVLACECRLVTAMLPPPPAAMTLERSISTMEGNGCSDVRWTVDMEARKIRVSFKSAVGAEWVGFGISEYGSMKGADIALVKMLNDDEFVVEDLVATDFVRPRKDILQNVELLYADLDDEGRIHALVERPLDSCDADDIAIDSYKQSIVCASGYLDENDEATYHGPDQRSSTLVNFLVDEDVLFYGSLGLSDLEEYPQARAVDEHGIVTARSVGVDYTASLEPIALDIQLPNVTLEEGKVSSFVCVPFRIPSTDSFRLIAVETVWGDGQVQSNGGHHPPHIHHQVLFQCDGSPEEEGRVEGQAYDCGDAMPACPISAGVARTPLTKYPPGVHAPIDSGFYVLQVHYENLSGTQLTNDRAGLRLWAEPPSLPTRTLPSKAVAHHAWLDTIHIPADPEQKDYAIHYQISSEASRAMLPEEGVQMFITALHMHERGLRGSLKIIRDGVHIIDVFDTLSYDHNSQQPTLKRWKYMPGDALIMTCVYKPYKDKDIYGGENADSEMCTFPVRMIPPVPGYDIGFGVATPADSNTFGNSFLGTGRQFADATVTVGSYPPSHTASDFKSLKHHRADICEWAVREKLDVSPVRLTDPACNMVLFLLVVWVFVWLASKWTRIKVLTPERIKRNTVCYAVELIFGTIALPFLLRDYSLLLVNEQNFDAVDAEKYVATRFFGIAVIFLYIAELFYKLEVRFDLVLHHVVAIIMGSLCALAGHALAFKVSLRIGGALGLMVATEQPMFLALLLKNMGYSKRKWWPKLCYFAGVFNAITKAILIALVAYAIATSFRGVDASWEVGIWSFSKWWEPPHAMNAKGFTAIMSVFLAVLTVAQVFLGKTLFALASRYRILAQQYDEEACVDDGHKAENRMIKTDMDPTGTAERFSDPSGGGMDSTECCSNPSSAC